MDKLIRAATEAVYNYNQGYGLETITAMKNLEIAILQITCPACGVKSNGICESCHILGSMLENC